MALSSCTTLSNGDMNIDDYFDFDAASCDSASSTTGWEFLHAQTVGIAPPHDDFEGSMLEGLVLEHGTPQDTYQLKIDVASSLYATTYHDASLGLPPASASQYAFQESPEADDSSDSDSCWSAPGSPCSFLSTLSPPRSPISSGANNAEDDGGFLSDVDVHVLSFDTPSETASQTVVPSELSTLPFFQPREPSPPTSFDPVASTSPLATYLHAPCPIPPRGDTVVRLESIAQWPQKPELECLNRESTPPYDSDLSPSVHRVEIIHLDELPPSGSPSPDFSGPVHRVGGKQSRSKKSKKRVSCHICRLTFTRKADCDRHIDLKHGTPTKPKIYRVTGKDRQWCLGCLHILSRSDSRRRHENACPEFARYIKNGHVRGPIILPLPEIYSETNALYRLWCTKCFEASFSHPGERHAHEQTCSGPPSPT
ncbi:hypothetical protein FB451DRAFT_1250613 [Mycena latifolia]|nr:hypothetical protein FB451DRAFT_1250613 [Mycena latifolia]